LDTSFAGTGIWSLQPGPPDVSLNAVTVQSDGRLVAVGSMGSDYAHLAYAAVRINPDGTLDPSFGSTGIASLLPPGADAGATGSWEATAVAMQGASIIVAGGPDGGLQTIVIRLGSDGSLDRSFGNGGGASLMLTGMPNAYSPPDTGLVVQPDGRIVLASDTRTGRFELRRLTSDGHVDTSFGSGGHVTGPNTGATSGGSGLVFDGCGLVASGASGEDFALARFAP
jgi:uncharacterized delta-60 repeat protein